MITKRKILKLGGSKAITLPQEIADSVYFGDKVIFEITIKEVLEEQIAYRCKACQLEFVCERDNPYCPACDCEDLEEVEEYHEN